MAWAAFYPSVRPLPLPSSLTPRRPHLRALLTQNLFLPPSRSALLQPSHDRVLPNLLARFGLVFKGALPVYAALHTLPAVFLKRRKLVRRKTPQAEEDAPADEGAVGDVEQEKGPVDSSTAALGLNIGRSASGLQTPKRSSPPAAAGWTRWWRQIHWAELLKLLRRAVVGTVRSGTFLALFVVIYHCALPSPLLGSWMRSSGS